MHFLFFLADRFGGVKSPNQPRLFLLHRWGVGGLQIGLLGGEMVNVLIFQRAEKIDKVPFFLAHACLGLCEIAY